MPEIIQYGVHDSVILDCDYTYGNRTPGLMVKWFFRSKTKPVYQWIVSQQPQDIGILRGRVDLNYRASEDPLKMYRALRIVKLDTDISGEYICVVSTFIDEDVKSKHMTVFGEYDFLEFRFLWMNINFQEGLFKLNMYSLKKKKI